MKKVILVDDNKDILQMWKMFLDKLQYEAVTLDSAAAFRNYIDAESMQEVGCVVCDESLEDGLGSELFNLMRSRGSNVPFVIVSGYGSEEILAKVSEPESVTVLKKPISLMDLKSVIDDSFQQGSLAY